MWRSRDFCLCDLVTLRERGGGGGKVQEEAEPLLQQVCRIPKAFSSRDTVRMVA